MVIAGIDVGSNTLRLLIAEVDGNRTSWREIHSEQVITRLGSGFGSLRAEAIDRSILHLRRFAKIIEAHRPERTVAVATSAVREADNGADFLGRVKRETGLSIELISGEEEARRTATGVLAALPAAGPDLLIVDIGGGSTELIHTRLGKIGRIASLPLGVVRLAERHLKNDPPLSRELEGIVAEAKGVLASEMPKGDFSALVGTAGTVTTLAAIDQKMERYDPKKIHGYRLTGAAVGSLAQRLASLTLAQRKRVPGLEPGREDLIVAGSLLLLEIMRASGCADFIIVSEYGLREGIVLEEGKRCG